MTTLTVKDLLSFVDDYDHIVILTSSYSRFFFDGIKKELMTNEPIGSYGIDFLSCQIKKITASFLNNEPIIMIVVFYNKEDR